MFARAVNDIKWSTESYNTTELMSSHPAPLLVRVAQGHCGLQDSESLGQGQVIRIHRWLKQPRVKAMDVRGRYLSIPLDFDIPFDILSERRRTLSKRKTMLLADILRQYSLPRKVRFSSQHLTASQALDGDRLGVRLTFEPLDLLEIHQEIYLNGNAVNFGELDPSILSIPVHRDLEMTLATGLASGDKNWRRLMRELDNVVAKRVRFAAVQGNNKITLYGSKMEDENKKPVIKIDTSTMQKRQQSLGRAFYYGTLQRIKATDKETKSRPSKSVDMGSLLRSGQQTQGHVRGTDRRFDKRNEARRKTGVDSTDAVSISGTSTSATSMTDSTTDTMDTANTELWFTADSKDADLDDDMSDITNDEDVPSSYQTQSLFGSVSRLSLFRPSLWDGRDRNGHNANTQPRGKRWSDVKASHGRRLSASTNFSMEDISQARRNSLGQQGGSYLISLHRGLPDGRSEYGGRDDDDVDDDQDQDMEQSTDL